MNYINGNYAVIELPGGGRKKRALRSNENLMPEFPDSIDLKITNSCSHGCPYCHENSVPGGKSFNLRRTISVLSTLPSAPIEIAIGGGNVFDCSKDLYELLVWMNSYGFRPRITISYKDYLKREDLFNTPRWETRDDLDFKIIKQVGHFGVSLDRFIPEINTNYSDCVWHVVIGVIPISDMTSILEYPGPLKILILGFKQFGRAMNQEIKHLDSWRSLIKDYIQGGGIPGKTLGFDNLALEQLGIREYISDRDWETLWFGPEFSTSMYIDAVEETFAPTSRSRDRISWNDATLLGYFKNHKNVFSD